MARKTNQTTSIKTLTKIQILIGQAWVRLDN